MSPEIVRRYSAPVPRYTSYPTAPHFSADVGCDTYAAWSHGGQIGFCLDTLDDTEGTSNHRLSALLVHEVAHRGGAAHAIAPYCTSINSECRSEDDCIALALMDAYLCANNADSYRFLTYRFGVAANCHPVFGQAASGVGTSAQRGSESSSAVSPVQRCRPAAAAACCA